MKSSLKDFHSTLKIKKEHLYPHSPFGGFFIEVVMGL
jgi:hypothetical protein